MRENQTHGRGLLVSCAFTVDAFVVRVGGASGSLAASAFAASFPVTMGTSSTTRSSARLASSHND